MSNLFNLSEEEKNRIRGLHLIESQDKRITSVLSEAIPGPDSDRCMRVEFKCGDATITPDDITINLEKYLRPGLEYDGDFAKLKVGVSGPGGEDANEDVYNKRKQAVIDMLMDAITWKAPDGTTYIQEYLQNNIDIDPDWDTTETESVLRDRSRASEDPCDEYYEQFQFIELCFDELKPIPNIDSIARTFYDKTIGKTTGYDETAVYQELRKLRNKVDFDNFNAKLTATYGQNFYEIACDKISADLTPDWFDKSIVGKWFGMDPESEVTFATEIGTGDDTINGLLEDRFNSDPISC